MKHLILAPYPFSQAPSQRFRFELFLKSIEEKGWKYDFQSFLSTRGWHSLHKQGHVLEKIISLLAGFIRRFLVLSRLSKYEFVLVHRELTPFGPPIFEWIIAKVFRKKIIYDFDDSIWLTDVMNESRFWGWAKWRSKICLICKWSWKISVGNQYLADFALKSNNNVVIFPTVIDTQKYVRKPTPTQSVTIGWSGSHSTIKHFKYVIPALQRIKLTFGEAIQFVVIGDSTYSNKELGIRGKPWKEETEVEDLSKIDIGVMPLPDNDWSKGKCGLKGLQYMALSIPTIMSPVGVNSEIIQDGVNGFLAGNEDEWVEKISQLINDPKLRERLGKAGRMSVEKSYSVSANETKFLSLFD